MAQQILTQEYLKSILHYSIISGKFYWKVDKSYRSKKNSSPSCISKQSGYAQIGIDSTGYQAHRLAFLYIMGRWPLEIDHINHIRNCNPWVNIREVTRSMNKMNAPLPSNNTSGHMGVMFHKCTGKWAAVVKVNGKLTHLGLFNDKEDAIKIRKAAEAEYGYHCNHGEDYVR